jgi:2-amino-4-hydroxy-6-hydroxymethyldihydropteridine diphosphokinase
MTQTFLSLGSNLGDRMRHLRAAVEALGRGTFLEVGRVSTVYETDPVEVEGEQPEYLNCVVEARCEASAVELLCFCQGVEAALGRTGKGEKLPRTVDIDILLFGEEVIEKGPYLVVPHPGILRAFNIKGLMDLAPDVYIPGRGVVRMLLAGADLSGVKEFGEDL